MQTTRTISNNQLWLVNVSHTIFHKVIKDLSSLSLPAVYALRKINRYNKKIPVVYKYIINILKTQKSPLIVKNISMRIFDLFVKEEMVYPARYIYSKDVP